MVSILIGMNALRNIMYEYMMDYSVINENLVEST